MKVLKNYSEIVTYPYNKDNHKGIDIVGNNNGVHVLDYIIAIESGVVEKIRTDATGFEDGGSYGNYILLNHGNGYKTRYAHLAYNTIKVSLGENVNKGTILGYMGDTGYAFGGHLHFEIIKDDTIIDPTDYIFGNKKIIENVTNDNDKTTEENTNNKDDIGPETTKPKLIFTCNKEDNYYLYLNKGDKLYIDKV